MIKREEATHPNSCWNKADDDEYVFVLLSRDISAPAVVRFWVQERLRLGKNRSDDAQIQEALYAAGRMEAEAIARSQGFTN